MRAPEQLVHTRTRVRERYALMPLEGFPYSKLPVCPQAQARVLASPKLGAGFVQMLIDLPAGLTFPIERKQGIESFYFILSGSGKTTERSTPAMGLRPGKEKPPAEQKITPGSFGLIAPGVAAEIKAEQPLSLLLLQKQYEPASGIEPFESLHGHEAHVKKEIWGENPHSLLQTLIPDEMRFDIAMNIFTFDPGFGLPIVETHVMEHGLFFLQGKGLYLLGEDWMEVQAEDFIWMAPYCPQSFYATGPTPSRYLYYKNVNRDVSC
jgi:(S)-ureidoglycine aminohydrolase